MKNFTIFNQLTAMPKRLAMVLTVLFTLGVGSMWGQATLPVDYSFSGGKSSLPTGVSQSGLGTDYAASNAPYRLKFDTNGDYIQVKVDGAADKITIGVKQYATTEPQILIQGSVDGSNYTDIETISISVGQNNTAERSSTKSISSTYRYFRIKRSSGGNFGLGTLTISKAAASDPHIVTLVPGSGSVADTKLEEKSAGAGVTLPTATICDGWKFAGWKETSAVSTEITTAPTLLSAGSIYKPTNNCTLYAVYKRTEETEGTPTTTTKTYTHTITAKTWTANGVQALSNVSWTLNNEGSSYFGYDGTKGQQVGSGSDPATSISLTTSGFASATKITAVKISTSGASSVNAKVSVKVGSTSYTCNSSTNPVAITTTNTQYTFTGSSTGDITISWTQTSSKALYFKTIEVEYQTTSGGSSSTTYYHSTPDCGPTTYTVTFDANGHGTDPKAQTINSGETATEPTELKETGYTFGGWYENEQCTGNQFDFNTPITADITLYAKWTIAEYTIKATLDNCTVVPGIPTTYTYTGSAANLAYTFTPEDGYGLPKTITFSGCEYTWNQSTGVLTLTGVIKSNVTFTITAKKIHTIKWMVDGTTYTTGNPSTTVLNNEQVETIPTTPSLQCSGKTFVGWSDQEVSDGNKPSVLFTSAGTSPQILKNTTFHAVFATLTGSGNGQNTTDILTHEINGQGNTNTSYKDFSDKSYTSDAVYAGNSANGNNNTIKGVIQLRSNESSSGIVTTTSGGYAKSITVEWNSNTSAERTLDIYGKNEAYTAASDLYDANTRGTKLGSIVKGTSTVLTIDGDYRYIGLRSASNAIYINRISIVWSSSASDTYTDYTTTCSAAPQLDTPAKLNATNITSTSAKLNWGAVSNATKYIVTLLGEHEVNGTSYTIEGLTANQNYTWSVLAKGDGKSYSDSEKATSTFQTLQTHTVTFNANGHGTAPESQPVDHGGKATRPDNPTANGVSFVGWYTEPECTTPFNFSTMTITSDITLYAKWNVATYTVKWFVGGEERQSKTYNHGDALVLPTADLNCGGKTPIGWSESENYEHETTAPSGFFSTANGTVTANKNYYAVFADVNGSGGGTAWTETAIGDIQASDEVVITMTNGETTWALSSKNGTTKAPAANTATITNNAITSAIPSDLIWNISNDGNGNLTIYPNGTTTTWLYCINDNNGVRVGTNANKTFFISGNYLVNIATTRYVGVYTTNPDWRCYTNTTGNIANQTLKFYKKSSGGTTYTNYTTECTNAPKLDAPTDLNVSDLSCSSVTLSWTTVANASGYEVVRTLNAHNTTYTTDEPSITIEGLTGGNENSWKVRAMGDGVNHGNSDYTTGDNFTTLFSVKYYVDEALWHGCDNGCAANGGSFEICETTPTKANYDFAGWATSVGGEVAYQAGEVINNIAANITLHAVWALSNHTVNWSVNGQDNKVTYPHGQDLALPSISITPCVDMEHIGWTNEMVYVHNTDLLFTEAEGTVTSDTAFYAVFATPHTSTGEPTTTTLDFTARGYSNEEDITSATEGAIKVTFDKGTNSNAPKYYNNGTAIRIYGGGYFTVSSENTISKITITFGSSDGTNAITTDCGTYYNGTWTGSAKSIKFTIGGTSGNRRIQKLAVTSAGTSKYHNGHTTTCDIKTIANPTNLKATYITYNGATLTWEEVGARTYSISIDGKTYETNHNAITITGLKEKTTYTWSVQAKGNGSNYLHSDIVNGPSFTTGTALELTWSVSAKKHHTTITLGQPIGKLPSYPVPNGCAGKYFIGWTTTNSINNDGTGITYITSDETPLVPTTYYAVYATPEGNAAGAELFQESFTANDGTGGNDDKWSGGIASSKLDSYGNWEELQYVYKGYQCIKLGTGSGLGKITTPALGINGSATLTFKAGAWNGSDEKLNILVTIVGNGSIEPSSFTLTKGEFNDYNANITGADENTKVTFAATNNSDNRFFLDEVIVTDGSSITYTDYTTSCGDFLVTFYGFTGGYSTTCDGNPAEIAVPQGSDYIIPNCTPATDPQGLGRTFAGTWNTKANGSGTSYAPGATIEYVNDNITLYAQWTMATSGNTTLPTDESGIADLANTDVIVYGGNTLTLAEGTTTIKSLTLKGGIQKDKSYAMPVVKIPDNATLVRKDNKINLDLKINNQNFYPFAVPFEVANTAANINYINTTLKEYVNAHNGYGKFYVIREYNGALRAENGANKDENWVHVGRSDVKLLPGKGYIISAVPAAGTDTVTIRITMTVDNKWLANGEQTSITSGSNTITRNQVGVTAYTGPAATNDPCNAGWNFVANPYLTNFAGASMKDDNDQDLDYIKGEIIVNNGHFEHDGREIPYVTIPASDFGWYDQYRVSDVKLSPMWSFFVQIGTDGTMNFTTAGRQQAPAALRANAAAENPRIEANLAILYGEQKADHTGLIIDDRYTSDYEIGADLEKMFGSAYNTTIYTLSNSTRLAYNAVPHQLAQQSIPLGFRAAEEGDYTISLTNYEEITGVESIILHDLYTNEKTNLLHLDYNFYTDQTQDDNRFVVYLVPRDNTATDISTIIDEAQQSENRKVLINNHLYIIHNGKVYNGAGQIVK